MKIIFDLYIFEKILTIDTKHTLQKLLKSFFFGKRFSDLKSFQNKLATLGFALSYLQNIHLYNNVLFNYLKNNSAFNFQHELSFTSNTRVKLQSDCTLWKSNKMFKLHMENFSRTK